MRYRCIAVLLIISILFCVITGCSKEPEAVDNTLVMRIDKISFPDDSFRRIVHKRIDVNQDGFLSRDEITTITELDVSESHIESLRGIEFFTELETLDCSYNSLYELDLTNNLYIKSLNAKVNRSLKSISVNTNSSISVAATRLRATQGTNIYNSSLIDGISVCVDEDCELILANCTFDHLYGELVSDSNGVLLNVNMPIYIDTASEEIIRRVYTYAFGREADNAGLVYWSYLFQNGEHFEVIKQMLLSSEVTSKNYTIGKLVDITYQVLFNRLATTTEKYTYTNLCNETSLSEMLDCIANDNSFNSSFVWANQYVKKYVTCTADTFLFVSNVVEVLSICTEFQCNYSQVLNGVISIQWGMKTVNEYLTQVLSPAYTGELSDLDYITTLYTVLFNRIPDDYYWINQLTTRSCTRQEALVSFLASDEWSRVCSNMRLHN